MREVKFKMKKIIWVSLGGMLSIFAVIIFCFFTKDYRVSREKSYIPYTGAIDIYNASREELIALDMCNYSGVFGKVKNEKEASQIAAKVIKEVYGEDESPYIVKLNKNANAWIVSGSLPLFHLGGVASIAIDKETGEVLMSIHTK